MNYLLIRHKVADFAKWKPAYDAHGSARANAGLKEERLLRNIDNPNEAVSLFSAQDLNKAKQFGASYDLRQRMQQAGVTDNPDIWLWNAGKADQLPIESAAAAKKESADTLKR